MSIHNATSIPRKRLRENDQVGEVDKRPFTIAATSFNSFSATQSQNLRTFTPVCLLSRTQLPLVWLAPSSISSTSQGGVFEGNVRTLEVSGRVGDEISVLIAKEQFLGTDRCVLYAIERVDRSSFSHRRGRYALCKLGDWVNEDMVMTGARCLVVSSHSERPAKRRTVQSLPEKDALPWWKTAAVDVNVTSLASAVALPTSTVPLVRMRQPSQALGKSKEDEGATTRPVEAVDQAESAVVTASEVPQTTEPTAESSPQDVLSELVTQYLSALYLSRTSLAFFVKGPLSRARAAARLAHDGSGAARIGISELIACLRSTLLISSSLADKKYRDGIHEAVRSFAPQTIDKVPTKKKRKKVKLKRGKDGFLADEREYLEKWWHGEVDSEAGSAIVDGDALKKQIDKIRDREAFLQIVILLELMALEAANPPALVTDQASFPILGAGETQQADTQATKTKSNKASNQDLPALLETLLDKVCIRHTLATGSPSAKRSKLDDSQGANARNDDGQDELKSFCVEVVVPFYTSRIPVHVATVNRKLGGPSAPSPVARKTSSSAARRPGQPASRQPPEERSRRPLERVGSETQNRGRNSRFNRPPSLQRSATDSLTVFTDIPIKREPSDSRESSQTPLAALPPAKLSRSNSQLQPGHSRRNSLVGELKQFGRREVDLSAISAANEIKARKKRDVEARLKEAVAGIRKPNRAMAAAEIDKEKSLLLDARGSVAVASTPCASRKGGRRGLKTVKESLKGNDKGARNQVENSSPDYERYASAFQPPMSTPAVPATGHRSRFTTGKESESSSFTRPRAFADVQGTPTRGFAKFMPVGLIREPGTLVTAESPTAKRLLSTPSKPAPSTPACPFITPRQSHQSLLRHDNVDARSAGLASLLHQTPVRCASPLVEASPNPMRAGNAVAVNSDHTGKGGQSEGDLYNALGWDDDGYEDLA